jgi:hypothetical protein
VDIHLTVVHEVIADGIVIIGPLEFETVSFGVARLAGPGESQARVGLAPFCAALFGGATRHRRVNKDPVTAA